MSLWQTGHLVFLKSHSLIQLGWNLWKQDKKSMSVFSSKFSIQIEHFLSSSTSLSFDIYSVTVND